MNWSIFLTCMDKSEFHELVEMVKKEKMRREDGLEVKGESYPHPKLTWVEWCYRITNDKIKAIKSYKERTGLGLKESKEAVEHYWTKDYYQQ